MRKILFVAANPKSTDRLSLDEEAKEIREGLARSKGRDQFEIITRWAVDAEGLRRSLLDIEPHIVHFSGHGAGESGLVLHAAEGRTKLASSQALANLFGLFAGQIECVLLNACYSEVQAKAIHQHVDYVVGMNRAVGDRAAIKFAVGFYDALGAGRAYSVAYKFGCSAIDFEDVVQSLTPVLMARDSAVDTSRLEASSGTAAGQTTPISDARDISLADAEDDGADSETGAGAVDGAATGVILENPEGQVPL